MTHIHTDEEDIKKLYTCIGDELEYIHKLLDAEAVSPFQLELALKALERREHALHMRLDPLRKIDPNLSLIPKPLCKKILNEILQIERDNTLRMKVTNALKQASQFFACLDRLRIELGGEAQLGKNIPTKQAGQRVERADDASDHQKREGG